MARASVVKHALQPYFFLHGRFSGIGSHRHAALDAPEPCHAVPQQYGRVRLSVLLGNITRRWHTSAFAPWRLAPAGSFSLCLSGQDAETRFTDNGRFLALNLDAEFLTKPLARFPDATRADPDLYGARDPFLLHLAPGRPGRDGPSHQSLPWTSRNRPGGWYWAAMGTPRSARRSPDGWLRWKPSGTPPVRWTLTLRPRLEREWSVLASQW